jgi:hypothetical protein
MNGDALSCPRKDFCGSALASAQSDRNTARIAVLTDFHMELKPPTETLN